MQKILNNFLNLFECVNFKKFFYKFLDSSISAGKIVKNLCGFSLLKIQRLIGVVDRMDGSIN